MCTDGEQMLNSELKICSKTYRHNAESQGRNSRDQFRAGLYKKEGCTIPPPCSDKELKSAFLSHLTPEKKLSPFISTFENFLPALNRALKSDKDAFIAIIDLQKHEKSARKLFPKSAEVIWPVRLDNLSCHSSC